MSLPSAEDRANGRAPLALLIFLALMTSVVALTIDAILPAVDGISADLGFESPTDRNYLILVVFLGMGLAQPVFGPLSDAIGRRRTATIGWVVFAAGSVIAMTATGFEAVLFGRLMQGVGAAGPRVVATAIVRDLYEGRAMARIISLVMTIFMLVPMVAPLIGQQVEFLGGWRAIFVLYLAMAAGCATLHFVMVPETLAPQNVKPLSLRPLARAFAEVLTTPTTMLYTLASGAIFSAFAAMLSSAQMVYEEIFGLGALFPLVFALVALLIAAAQYANSRLVMSLGMRFLARLAAALVSVFAALALVVSAVFYGPVPPLWLFLLLMSPVYVGAGLMFSNLTALALEPMGHIAGTASAVVLSISTLLAVPVGTMISRQVDGTVLPLMAGFAGAGTAMLVLVVIADRVRADRVRAA